MINVLIEKISSFTQFSTDLLKLSKSILSIFCSKSKEITTDSQKICKLIFPHLQRFLCEKFALKNIPSDSQDFRIFNDTILWILLYLCELNSENANFICQSFIQHLLTDCKNCHNTGYIILFLAENNLSFFMNLKSPKNYNILLDIFNNLSKSEIFHQPAPHLDTIKNSEKTPTLRIKDTGIMTVPNKYVTKKTLQLPETDNMPPPVHVFDPEKNEKAQKPISPKPAKFRYSSNNLLSVIEKPNIIRASLMGANCQPLANQPMSRSIRRLHIARVSCFQQTGVESAENHTNATSQKYPEGILSKPAVPRLNIKLVHEPLSPLKVISRSSRREKSGTNRSEKISGLPIKNMGSIEQNNKVSSPTNNDLSPVQAKHVAKASNSWVESETHIDHNTSSRQDQKQVSAKEKMKELAHELGECCLAVDLAALIAIKREAVLNGLYQSPIRRDKTQKTESSMATFEFQFAKKSEKEQLIQILLNLIALVIQSEPLENLKDLRSPINSVYLFCSSPYYIQLYRNNRFCVFFLIV